ncbi:Sperm-associated antigen 16 protein [Heterocephalus glaber]|uniref:Sperm-associated antigen 16 protein n=1 Tax=Heterocephalus glaber TaxID=10181 RepID=G5C865_HETGA|nr:Sperm-associated antigen 16 protein [Heterocephalus glaber]
MAAPQSQSNSPLRVLEEALGTGLAAAGDTEDAEAAEGAYYLERRSIICKAHVFESPGLEVGKDIHHHP